MEKSFIEVFDKSFEKVIKIVEEQNLKKEVELKDNKIFVSYFKNRVEIDLTKRKFYPELEDREKILILHYVCGKYKINEENEGDEIITFKNLPEGSFYFPSIYSRIYQPLIEKYKENSDKFFEKMVEIGREKITDYSVKIKIFPDVFFIFEIIPEDDEFPADLRVFFNKISSEIFEIEDLTIIGEIIVSKIL